MDIELLNQLWRAGLPISTIARRLKATPYAVQGTIRRHRVKEGTERWPNRLSAVQLSAARAKPATPRAGKSTLPPLASLRG
jgi:hypothetical protein